MNSLIVLVKFLLALTALINETINYVVSRADAETRAKLHAAIQDAQKAKTTKEASDAAKKINDSFRS